MLNFQDFFAACTGLWITERTYHSVLDNDVERSHTEFRVSTLTQTDKERILGGYVTPQSDSTDLQIDPRVLAAGNQTCPGFAIAFDTVSERGEQVSMSLSALFVPDAQVLSSRLDLGTLPIPVAAQVDGPPAGDIVQGYYLRDEGYSEAGAIAGRFTYQPTRRILEMTTFYKRSVAVDQMRLIAPDVRLRTIVTYQRPADATPPTVITLVGFGVERRHLETAA